jgi:hypothetical protein
VYTQEESHRIDLDDRNNENQHGLDDFR